MSRSGINKRKIVYCPSHPNSWKNGFILYHRLVKEVQIGRYLKKDEIVHHRDGNKDNDDTKNLKIEDLTYLGAMEIEERIWKPGGDVLFPDYPKHRAEFLIRWNEKHPPKTNLDVEKEKIAKMTAEEYYQKHPDGCNSCTQFNEHCEHYVTADCEKYQLKWLNAPAEGGNR